MSLSGNFTSKDDLNLLVAKNNRIGIYTICEGGLRAIRDINIFGKIAYMNLFKPSKV